jgi:hypothetical protein
MKRYKLFIILLVLNLLSCKSKIEKENIPDNNKNIEAKKKLGEVQTLKTVEKIETVTNEVIAEEVVIDPFKLNRELAMQIIKSRYNLPSIQSVKFPKRIFKEHDFSGGFGKVCLRSGNTLYFDSNKDNLEKLVQLGYIELKEDDYFDECNDLYVNINLTEKGKKEIIGEDDNFYIVNLCTNTISEISGISEYKEYNLADVDYVLYKYNFTEFGKIVNQIVSLYVPYSKDKISKIANFKLYDDGWRIAN